MLQMESYLEDKNIIEPCSEACAYCFLQYADIIGENSLFKGLEINEVRHIIRNAQHKVRDYGKGDLIASEGDRLNYLMMVIQGSVIGEMMDFEGRILRVEHLTAPNTVATVFLFGENNRLPVNVIAMEDTKILLISKQGLMDLFCDNNIVMKNFLDIMANRAQFLSKQMKILGLSTIKGKIAHYLLEQVKKSDTLKFRLQHTQNELAEMFGVTRPSLGRTLREMNMEGLISTKGKDVEVLQKVKLATLIR